jgi:hypothetical protein
MTGTLYGNAQFHWERGFFFGAGLGALGAIVVYFKCRPPTREQWQIALAKAEAAEARKVPIERPAV